MVKSIPSKLFHRPGYIPLKEYVDDINHMREYGPWKLPLGMGDRLQLFLLSLVAKFSWFSDDLYIAHPDGWSPAYAVLISYLRRKGIFDSLVEEDSDHPGYFFFYAEKRISVDEYIMICSGQATDQDSSVALSKTLGETIERVVSGLEDKNTHVLVASPNEIVGKFPTLYPPKYHRFLAVQKESYRELQHDPANVLTWVAGRNIITGEKTYIPRQMTSWFGFGEARRYKDVLLNPTSNGCAGYFTKTGAVLRGLLETVQRDGFLVHWLTQIAPERVARESLPEAIQQSIQMFETRGISLHVLNVTSLNIPSICIVAINAQSETPRIILTGAAATTLEQAISDALKEMVHISKMFSMKDDPKLRRHLLAMKPFVANLGQKARQLYWHGSERVRQFEWFLSGKQVSYDEICGQDIPSDTNDVHQLRACLDVLKKMGPDYYPIAYFPEHPLQSELGFYIAQAYIPKAFPLYLLEYQGTFDSERLREFALSKGVSNWELNPLPHMFS